MNPPQQDLGAPRHADGTEEQFLSALGARVRSDRTAVGLSRRALAVRADVSERYLAQLESGRGNISILLLRRIAHALDTPLGALMLDGVAAPALREVLTLLPAAPGGVREEALRAARDLLQRGRGHPASIALLGLRGAGKSTLGRLAGKQLGLPFLELNERITKTSGLAVPEIFDLYGTEGYRRLERRCLEQVIDAGAGVILAVGGGIVAQAETLERLLGSFFTVWVRATPEEHMARLREQGDTRPMAGAEDAMRSLRSILVRRQALYTRADRQLDTSGRSVENCARSLVQMLQEAGFATPERVPRHTSAPIKD